MRITVAIEAQIMAVIIASPMTAEGYWAICLNVRPSPRTLSLSHPASPEKADRILSPTE